MYQTFSSSLRFTVLSNLPLGQFLDNGLKPTWTPRGTYYDMKPVLYTLWLPLNFLSSAYVKLRRKAGTSVLGTRGWTTESGRTTPGCAWQRQTWWPRRKTLLEDRPRREFSPGSPPVQLGLKILYALLCWAPCRRSKVSSWYRSATYDEQQNQSQKPGYCQ